MACASVLVHVHRDVNVRKAVLKRGPFQLEEKAVHMRTNTLACAYPCVHLLGFKCTYLCQRPCHRLFAACRVHFLLNLLIRVLVAREQDEKGHRALLARLDHKCIKVLLTRSSYLVLLRQSE